MRRRMIALLCVGAAALGRTAATEAAAATPVVVHATAQGVGVATPNSVQFFDRSGRVIWSGDGVAIPTAAFTSIDRIAVVTSDSEVAAHARRAGALVFEENQQVSHSVSADAACLRAMELGASTVLLVPIDVPTATPSDFTRLAASARPGLIVVPSSDGTGTNAAGNKASSLLQGAESLLNRNRGATNATTTNQPGSILDQFLKPKNK